MALPEVAPELHAGDGMLMAWHTEPIAPWQTEAWLAEMRRTMRPSAFARMIQNQFVTSESTFIDMAAWDRVCPADADARAQDRQLPSGSVSTHRSNAITLRLSPAPTTRKPMRPSRAASCVHAQRRATPSISSRPSRARCSIGAQRYLVRKVWFDPFQMVAVHSAWQKAACADRRISANAVKLDGRYAKPFRPDPIAHDCFIPTHRCALQSRRAIIVESSRGWRLDKLKQQHKIDVIVALSMAALAAVRGAGEFTYDLWTASRTRRWTSVCGHCSHHLQYRAHADLVRRYGQPSSPCPLPDELVKQVKAAEAGEDMSDYMGREPIEGMSLEQQRACEAATRLAPPAMHDGIMRTIAANLPGPPPWGPGAVEGAIRQALS